MKLRNSKCLQFAYKASAIWRLGYDILQHCVFSHKLLFSNPSSRYTSTEWIRMEHTNEFRTRKVTGAIMQSRNTAATKLSTYYNRTAPSRSRLRSERDVTVFTNRRTKFRRVAPRRKGLVVGAAEPPCGSTLTAIAAVRAKSTLE
jgi:hypothetical protein